MMYTKHNPDDLEQGWDAVDEYAENALLAAWDGCHKIYMAMDPHEAAWFRENYSEHIVEAGEDGSTIVDAIRNWWLDSCPLRFVNAVWHDEVDPNAGFVSIISQFARDEYDDYEDDDESDLY